MSDRSTNDVPGDRNGEGPGGSVAGGDSTPTEPPGPSPIRSDEVLELISSVENQLQHMRSAQSERVAEIETLEDRRLHVEDQGRELDRRQAEHQRAAEALEHRRASLESELGSLARREQALAAQAEEHSAHCLELERREGALRDRGEELDRSIADLESRESEFAEARASFASESSTLQERLAEAESAKADSLGRCTRLEQQCSELLAANRELEAAALRNEQEARERDEGERALHAELAASRSDGEQLARELEEANQAVERHQLAVEARESELAGLQSDLGTAMERLRSLAEAVAAQAPRLEEGAEALALCRSQRQRIESLSNELSEARRALADAGPEADASALETCRQELERLRADLEDSIPHDEHQRVVAALEARLSTGPQGSGADTDPSPELTSRLAASTAEVQLLRARSGARERTIEEQAQRISELDARCRELESDASSTTTPVSQDALRLREQAKRLSGFAQHLQRRRARLNSVRSAVRERLRCGEGATPAGGRGDGRDEADRTEHEDLLRKRHELADRESQMLRRWACQGSIGSVSRLCVALVLLAIASWFGVRSLLPGTVTATSLVRAQPINGATLDAEQGRAWNDWHQAVLADPIFVNLVRDRIDQSVGFLPGTVDSLERFIASGLTVTSMQPGLLQVRLAGSNRSDSLGVLEAIVTTLVSESQRQLSRRGDGARAEVLPSDGRLATLEPIPVTSHQVRTAGMFFGGSTAVLGLLGFGVYSRLRRSRRLFDRDLGLEDTFID